MSLYRCILPRMESHPLVPASNQGQLWTKCSPVHLTSICNVHDGEARGYVQGGPPDPVFPSVRVFSFDDVSVHGASLQCQKVTALGNPKVISRGQEEWTYCDVSSALEPLAILAHGNRDPFGHMHSTPVYNSADSTIGIDPGVHGRARSASGSRDPVSKRNDKTLRFSEKTISYPLPLL